MMLVIFCCLLFLIMIVYPFWPGYKEMKRGQDNDNLYIKKIMLKIRVILVCPLEICWNLF